MHTKMGNRLALALLALSMSSVVQAQSCASPTPLPSGPTVAGNTCTGSNQLGTLCGAFASPENDIVFSFTVPTPHVGSTITLTNNTPGWNAALVLLSGTCGPGVSCTDVADNNGAGGNETLPPPGPGGLYFLIVSSSPGAGGCGSFTIGGTYPVQLQSFSVE